MKLKGRTILVICLLIFGGYAIYDFQQEKKRDEKAAQDVRLLTVNFEQVNEVRIEKEAQKIVLKRSESGWDLVEPIKDSADNTVVDDFIKNTVPERAIDVAKEGADIDWSIYGLAKPIGTVIFKTSAGTQNSFEVSDKRNFEENTFVRRDGENRALVVNSVWQGRVNKSVLDFRDRRFFRHKIASVDEVKLKNEKGFLHLRRTDGQWSVVGKADLKVDQNKVREVLTAISDAKAADILDKKTEGLKKLISLELILDGKSWTADVEQARDLTIFANISEPKFFLKMEPGALDRFLKMTADDFKEAPPEKKDPSQIEAQKSQSEKDKK